jgi:hypothetical protein
MKRYLLLCSFFWLLSCSDDRTTVKTLQGEINYLNKRNDSLAKQLEAIKPGLGDLMLMIQVHHNKLYFAGKEGNWPLAQFEHDEIMELLKQAEEIEKDRSEVKLFHIMIYPQLDTLQQSISAKNGDRFITSFEGLTRACNNCHTDTKFGFNKIIIPEHPPYSNQEF